LSYSTTLTISLLAHNIAGASTASKPSLPITTPPPPPPPPPPPCQVDPDAVLEITEKLVGGISVPSTAATKPTASTSAHGYSGSISWSFSQLSGSKSTLADSVFGAMRTYTATIQLTPDCPKGKIKVPSNFFTISGASSVSNAENSGVITAVFPATGPGVPNKAMIVTQPSGGMIDIALATQPVIRVTDIDDNTNATFAGSMTATTSGGLSGATVSAVGGIVTYTSLAVTSPPAGGNIQITFTPVGLIAATSNTIAISPKPKMTFTTEPSSTIARRSVFGSIILQFKTCGGSSCTSTDPTDTSITETVTASITSGSGGSLIGTVSVTAVAGVATFANLALDGTIKSNIGNNRNVEYKISFTSERFGLKESNAITLTGTQCNGSFVCQVSDTGPGGGIIFYASVTAFLCGEYRTSSCNYLEAAPLSGDNAGVAWSGNTNLEIGTTAQRTEIGTGYANTLAIVNDNNTSGKAGTIAWAYSVNSLNDWFLPSRDELKELLDNPLLGKANATDRSSEGYAGEYWSSTETMGPAGRCINGPNPQPGTCAISVTDSGAIDSAEQKSALYRIRPVRSF